MNPNEHLDLASSIARRLVRLKPSLRGLDPDDAAQEAYLVLARCCEEGRFDPSRGARFSTYLGTAIYNRLVGLSRRARTHGPLSPDIEARRETLLVDHADSVGVALSLLSERDREILESLLEPDHLAARDRWCARWGRSKVQFYQCEGKVFKRLRCLMKEGAG